MQSRKSKKVSSTLHAEQQTTNAVLFRQLQQQFEQWRANKSRNDPVPPALCQAAIRAIDNGMPFSKLKLLRVNHSQLKRWREQESVSSKTTSHFVTVEPIDNTAAVASTPMQTTACELKLHYPHGLRVDIRVCDVTSAAQLLKTLC